VEEHQPEEKPGEKATEEQVAAEEVKDAVPESSEEQS
jgi:hypothetical protein